VNNPFIGLIRSESSGFSWKTLRQFIKSECCCNAYDRHRELESKNQALTSLNHWTATTTQCVLTYSQGAYLYAPLP